MLRGLMGSGRIVTFAVTIPWNRVAKLVIGGVQIAVATTVV